MILFGIFQIVISIFVIVTTFAIGYLFFVVNPILLVIVFSIGLYFFFMFFVVLFLYFFATLFALPSTLGEARIVFSTLHTVQVFITIYISRTFIILLHNHLNVQ